MLNIQLYLIIWGWQCSPFSSASEPAIFYSYKSWLLSYITEKLSNFLVCIGVFYAVLQPGVSPREGSGGQSPLVKISAYFEGLSPPKTLALAWLFRVYWPCSQSAMINCVLFYGY